MAARHQAPPPRWPSRRWSANASSRSTHEPCPRHEGEPDSSDEPSHSFRYLPEPVERAVFTAGPRLLWLSGKHPHGSSCPVGCCSARRYAPSPQPTGPSPQHRSSRPGERPGQDPVTTRAPLSPLPASTCPGGPLTRTLLHRIRELPSRGRKLSERLRDRQHAHPGARAAQGLDRLIEPFPRVSRRKRRAPGRGTKLLRWQPCRPRAPAEPLLLGVAVCRLLLRGGIGKRSQAARVTRIRRRLGVLLNRGLPATLG